METSTAPLNKTELNDRILWFDGSSTVDNADIVRMLSLGLSVEGLFVAQIDEEIKQYNKLVPKEQRIQIKDKTNPLSFEWNIPDEFKQLDVRQYVIERLYEEFDAHPEWIVEKPLEPAVTRAVRTSDELHLYKTMGLYDVLRALIFIINTLRKNDIVWGVGRGSSVSSYVLYLIGVHDVDSVEYDLDVTDFLRNK